MSKISERSKQCFDLEMNFDGKTFLGKHSYNRVFNIHHTEITCDTDEQWNEKISKLHATLKRRKLEYEGCGFETGDYIPFPSKNK